MICDVITNYYDYPETRYVVDLIRVNKSDLDKKISDYKRQFPMLKIIKIIEYKDLFDWMRKKGYEPKLNRYYELNKKNINKINLLDSLKD